MPYRGYTAITVKRDLYETLQRRHEEKFGKARVKPSLSAYVSELLWDVLERDELLRRFGPLMEYRETYDGRVRLQDNRSNEIVDVTVRDGKLLCVKDRRDDCVHVGFCFATAEVYKVLADHGLKAPKVR